jgi:hypothetical protein
MDPQYICSNCLYYSSPQSTQGICKRYSFVDTPKLANDFCGEHSLFKKDYFTMGQPSRSGEDLLVVEENKLKLEESQSAPPPPDPAPKKKKGGK